MNFLQNITFLDKYYFWGLVLVPVVLYLFYKKEKSGIKFLFFGELKKTYKFNSMKFYLKLLILALILINFIVILANPHKTNISEKIKKNWIDIVFALDISWSMEAQDLKPSRLEAAKKTIIWFLDKLKTDRAWLVVFAWKPFSSIPLTFDYNILKETISRLTTKNINQQKAWLNWTNIWDSILLAETLFKPHPNPLLWEERGQKKEDRQKVIILLTDWDANVWVNPIIAAKDALANNIKIYTIWIWSKSWGYISYNVWPFVQRQRIPPLNDKVLKQIAQITNWQFFRATDNFSLQKIFDYLWKLEKNDIEVEVKKEYKEYYSIFVYSLVFLIFIFWTLVISNLEVNRNNKGK